MSFLPYGGGSMSGWVGAFGFSAVLHGALVVGGIAFYGNLLSAPKPEDSQANFVVTLERLDADTLAGIVEQTGEAGAQGTDPAATDPVPPEPATVDAVPPPEPEVPAPTEPDVLPAAGDLVPETPAPVQAETATTLDQAAEPLVAQAVEAVTISPDDSALNPILPETVAAASGGSAPQTIVPVTPDAGTAAVSATPDAPVVVAAVSPSAVTVGARPAPSAAPAAAAAPPSEQDLAIGDLIRRIRVAPPDPCLIALPRRDGDAGVGIALIAAQDGAMEGFAQAVFTTEDTAIRQTRTLVDPRQCPALSFVRANVDYPATRMGLRIDELEITSGGRLTGVVRGAAGRHLTVLLIDDNGVVQDLQRFMTFSGNLARVDVPVTRSGPSRDTSQILLALGTQRPPTVLRDRNGQLAQDVFAGLTGDLATGAYIAIATFDVR